MRRSASEVIRDLESRIANLEGNKTASKVKNLSSVKEMLLDVLIDVDPNSSRGLSDAERVEMMMDAMRTAHRQLEAISSAMSPHIRAIGSASQELSLLK